MSALESSNVRFRAGSPDPHHAVLRGGTGGASPRSRSQRGVFALVPMAAAASAFFLSTGSTLPSAEANVAVSVVPEVPVDAALCPRDSAAAGRRAVYLIDLSKPLLGKRQSLPGDLLDRLANRLDKGDELAVFAVSEYALAPRIPLGQLCKPYAAADIARPTKTHVAPGESECGKLPVQMPHALREAATAFCEQRERLRQRVDDLAARHTARGDHARLVEAIEETVAEIPADAPAPTLHIFSDTFQEADWRSHAQVNGRRWVFARGTAEQEHAIAVAAKSPEPARLAATVEIVYSPRLDSTTRSH